MSDETITAFEKHQQELMDRAKVKLKKVCDEALGELYSDISYYADADANINYKNKFREECTREFEVEIKSEYSFYSWAHNMRMNLLKHHKEEISNKIVEDLQNKIKSLEDHIEQLRRYR